MSPLGSFRQRSKVRVLMPMAARAKAILQPALLASNINEMASARSASSIRLPRPPLPPRFPGLFFEYDERCLFRECFLFAAKVALQFFYFFLSGNQLWILSGATRNFPFCRLRQGLCFPIH
jgi:hypothetical protein